MARGQIEQGEQEEQGESNGLVMTGNWVMLRVRGLLLRRVSHGGGTLEGYMYSISCRIHDQFHCY